MSITSWHVGGTQDVANAPLMAELIKFPILQELRSSVSVDYFGNAKVGDQCHSLINYLLCGARFPSFIDAGVTAELACRNQVILTLLLANVHMKVLKWVCTWFMSQD